MKVVDRKTFLTMSGGTVFQKYERSGNLGNLEIKVCSPGKWGNDFVTVQLTEAWPVGPTNSEELFRKWESIEAGEAFMFEYETAGRDGLYDENQLFAVYDRKDIEQLIFQLQNILLLNP